MTVERIQELWDRPPYGLVGAGDGFHLMTGAQAHEVAVGPVHAGVIEPGHFRFQCLGEKVHYLEISLGYQHRGVERAIVAAESDARRLALAQTIAGDTSVAATLASSGALGIESPIASPVMAALLLELERIANHVGDLGALAGDVAYLPTASFCGRIRGEYLNMTALVTGNRFGRVLKPLAMTVEELKATDFPAWFARTERECFHALDLLFSETSAIERFEGTGRVSEAEAREIGMVGVAARASGVTDTMGGWPVTGGGDVLARARQRYEELKVAHERIHRLVSGDSSTDRIREIVETELAEGVTLRFAAVDAWRGELVHAAKFKDGALVDYRVFDPSYFNWFGLSLALRGEQISNFPICNKSFNLSYCGVDR